mmetsp:Transcript_2684/g.4151  ORF Transcript_2684/g.4151 Transcript_2684/m.4151 type:complete len:249 (+) Transcript_2684:211-957(+)
MICRALSAAIVRGPESPQRRSRSLSLSRSSFAPSNALIAATRAWAFRWNGKSTLRSLSSLATVAAVSLLLSFTLLLLIIFSSSSFLTFFSPSSPLSSSPLFSPPPPNPARLGKVTKPLSPNPEIFSTSSSTSLGAGAMAEGEGFIRRLTMDEVAVGLAALAMARNLLRSWALKSSMIVISNSPRSRLPVSSNAAPASLTVDTNAFEKRSKTPGLDIVTQGKPSTGTSSRPSKPKMLEMSKAEKFFIQW